MGFEGLHRSYDRVAVHYQQHFARELEHKPYDREVLARLAAEARGPVLDVGAGPGHVATYLAACGAVTSCVDLSFAMAALSSAAGHPSAVVDMLALPVRDRALGGLVALYSIIHLRRGEVPAALRELGRVVRSGGPVLVSAHAGEGEVHVEEFLGEQTPFAATLFALDELVEMARGAGLTVEEAVRRPPYEHEHPTERLYLWLRPR